MTSRPAIENTWPSGLADPIINGLKHDSSLITGALRGMYEGLRGTKTGITGSMGPVIVEKLSAVYTCTICGKDEIAILGLTDDPTQR